MDFWKITPLIGAALFMLHAPSASLEPDAKLRRTPLEHFELLSEFDISKEDLLLMRRHLAGARREVGQDFGIFPDAPIKVILSKTETFRKYTGFPEHVGGLFDGSIHIPLPSTVKDESVLKAVLWHEYTHALLFSAAGTRLPYWLHEGFAEYEEAKVRGPDLKFLKRFYKGRIGLPFPVARLDEALKGYREEPEDAKLAYEEAYGLVHFLFSRASRAQLAQFLSAVGSGRMETEDAFLEILRISLHDFEEEAAGHLKRLSGLN